MNRSRAVISNSGKMVAYATKMAATPPPAANNTQSLGMRKR
jgi:hypothetical protein